MTAKTLVPGTGPKTKGQGKGKDKAPKLARLVQRVAAGDRHAFEKLYRCTAGSVHALVRRLLPEDAVSAAVTAEVYVLVWSEARDYEQAGQTAESWLFDLAHRCALRRLRADRGRPAQEASVLPALAGGTDVSVTGVAPGATGVAAGRTAARMIRLLTPEQAEALELAYLGGATHAESAQALGVDQATFRIRVGTAISRLRQTMESDGRTPARRSKEPTEEPA